MFIIRQVISAWSTFRSCSTYFLLFCLVFLLIICALLGFIAGRVSIEWETQLTFMFF